MKSNFKKMKRYMPKTSRKRVLGETPSGRSYEPVKTKPLDIDAIKRAQEKVKTEKKEES